MTPTKHAILIVEDDPDLGKMMKRLLEGSGYRALLATDGIAGLAMAVAEKPQLVLMDIKMPKMDGELALVQLRGRTETAKIPVIMVTAMADLSDKHLAAQLDAVDYIEKPFDPAHLLNKIQTILGEPV